VNFLPTLTKIRLCLLPLAVFLAVTIFAPSATFAYDRHNQVKLTYDSSRESAFLGYDVGSMLARGDMENGIAGDRVRFFKFGELLAAKGATHWANPKTLADHFGRHGADFGAKSADDYARTASDFFRRSQAERLPTKIAPDGTIRVYDPKNNIFGSYNPSGTTKTFYKPDPAQHKLPSNLDYWNKQPGASPWQP